MRALGIILARGGSTRFPGKNLAKLGGLSLVAHAALRAQEAKLDELVVSTDSAEIAAELEPFGVKWVKRPEALSGPEATIEDAVAHALAVCEARCGEHFDYVVALQAAAPLRPPGAIRALLEQVERKNARGGVTVVRRSPWIWSTENGYAETWWKPARYPRSQDVTGTTLEEVNGIQVTPRAEARAGCRAASPLLLLELPAWAGVDIDHPEDLEQAEILWRGLQDSDVSATFRWQLVAHPELPKIRAPLDWGMGRNRHGIVLGNGPQIDALPDSFFRKLEGPQFLTIGVKRAVCATRLLRADYAPDLTLQWDCPQPGQALTEKLVAGLKSLEGRSWRLGSPEHNQGYFPHDQILRLDDKPDGWPGECRMWSVCTDAACNVLHRLGVEDLYLYGVELNDARHCEIEGGEEYREPHDLEHEQMRVKLTNDWRKFKAEHPKANVYCACRDSRLVREGVFEFREPPGLAL